MTVQPLFKIGDLVQPKMATFRDSEYFQDGSPAPVVEVLLEGNHVSYYLKGSTTRYGLYWNWEECSLEIVIPPLLLSPLFSLDEIDEARKLIAQMG